MLYPFVSFPSPSSTFIFSSMDALLGLLPSLPRFPHRATTIKLPASASTPNNHESHPHSHHNIYHHPLSRRRITLSTTTSVILLLSSGWALSSRADSSPRKPGLPAISSTKTWDQFVGDGFAIRVPPLFEDITEPEDYTAGLTLYGDRAKPKTYAAQFASPDRSETVSVIIRPCNQLKITFLEAKDIADLGSLKEAARIFVPGGATLQSARTIKIKEEEGLRTYYFYEFNVEEQHIALVASVNSGKAYIAGATASESKWIEDGVKLRSAAISLTVL
ncbi:uncharacterized protein LOC116264980 isoform X2 [Nymphaea colorata]|uniref:uncharacterized protein LOC116264980 isoform X2 n=1 Tax=Nymphaea colorata TaxID=210225 RepID=UPI00129DD91F|nr:uncharacterized protein LOC116264980 isoform X2 [Nymphaea colorata]